MSQYYDMQGRISHVNYNPRIPSKAVPMFPKLDTGSGKGWPVGSCGHVMTDGIQRHGLCRTCFEASKPKTETAPDCKVYVGLIDTNGMDKVPAAPAPKFKKGDRVLCVDAGTEAEKLPLKIRDVYEVDHVRGEFVYLHHCKDGGWGAWRFELVADEEIREGDFVSLVGSEFGINKHVFNKIRHRVKIISVDKTSKDTSYRSVNIENPDELNLPFYYPLEDCRKVSATGAAK